MSFLTANMKMVENILVFILNIVVLLSSYAALGSGTHKTYVVFMDSQKMESLQASLGPSRKWQEKIIESISISDQDDDDDSSPAQLHHVYDTVVQGFSAELSEKHLESLKRVDGFLHAFEDKSSTLHTTHSYQFLGLRPGQGLWSHENLVSDVIIGVVDSGIWPELRSFSDRGLPPVPSRWKGKCEAGTNFTASNCNRKLIGAATFFKGYESKYGRINETLDYRSARDAEGHGTQLASIAGGSFVGGANIFGRANGTASGMGYTVRLAVYKVCYEWVCTFSDTLAAMDRAVKDGVDVLSISIGPDKVLPYYNDPIAIGAFGAIRNRVIVSTSAGKGYGHLVNVAPWLMTVAASTTDRSVSARIHLDGGKTISGISLFSGNLPKQFSLVYNDDVEGAMYCEKGYLSRRRVRGKFVICIITGGDIEDDEREKVVQAAGAAGMILANNIDQNTNAMPFTLPTISLGASETSDILEYVAASNNPTATIEFIGDVYGNPAPVIAAYSPRGPSKVDPLTLKPDVTAPGVNILAAWPPNITPYGFENDKMSIVFNIDTGTSISCAHVSGVMALLKSVHRDWSPAAIKSALMTTAYVLDNKKSPIPDAGSFGYSKSATPFAFGSGHVDPERASDPGLIYDMSAQDYLHYLCGFKYNYKQLAIFGGNTTTCSGYARFRPGDLNYPSFSVTLSKEITTTTYKRTVTNVGIAVSNYTVKVTEPEGVSVTVQPNVLKFDKMTQTTSYHVTFTAKKGGMPTTRSSAFGSLEWVSSDCKYYVRSPIAMIWNN